MPKHKNKRHSGRGKEGMVLISIYLTPEENEGLIEIAEAALRSKGGQATWIIKEAIVKWQRETGNDQ